MLLGDLVTHSEECGYAWSYINSFYALNLILQKKKKQFLKFQGQCLFDQRLYGEALEKFSIAADMRPTVPGYHTRAIACLAALGRHQECLALVTRRLESEATANPELYVLRARLHLQFRNVRYDSSRGLNFRSLNLKKA